MRVRAARIAINNDRTFQMTGRCNEMASGAVWLFSPFFLCLITYEYLASLLYDDKT